MVRGWRGRMVVGRRRIKTLTLNLPGFVQIESFMPKRKKPVKKGVKLPFSNREAIAYLEAMQLTPSGASAGPTGAEHISTRYRHLDFTPPKEVADIALHGLRLKFVDGWKGGTDIGVGRAVQLALRMPVPPRDVRRMVQYAARHRKDLSSPKARSGKITPGVVAWELWGGHPGSLWAAGLLQEMKQADWLLQSL